MVVILAGCASPGTDPKAASPATAGANELVWEGSLLYNGSKDPKPIHQYAALLANSSPWISFLDQSRDAVRLLRGNQLKDVAPQSGGDAITIAKQDDHAIIVVMATTPRFEPPLGTRSLSTTRLIAYVESGDEWRMETVFEKQSLPEELQLLGAAVNARGQLGVLVQLSSITGDMRLEYRDNNGWHEGATTKGIAMSGLVSIGSDFAVCGTPPFSEHDFAPVLFRGSAETPWTRTPVSPLQATVCSATVDNDTTVHLLLDQPDDATAATPRHIEHVVLGPSGTKAERVPFKLESSSPQYSPPAMSIAKTTSGLLATLYQAPDPKLHLYINVAGKWREATPQGLDDVGASGSALGGKNNYVVLARGPSIELWGSKQ